MQASMTKERIRSILNGTTLSAAECLVAVEYIDQRFSDSTADYQAEWINRFAKRRAFAYSDGSGRLILNTLCAKFGLNPEKV